jgi:hypothetical protein
LQAEIEKVKKRREERALEKAQHEEEMVKAWFHDKDAILFLKSVPERAIDC